VKYLDPISWFEHKLVFAHTLDLHKRAPMRMLDVGTGAGHFMVIAKFYGHEAVGTDLPDGMEEDDPSHFYNALAKIYGTTRIAHRIEPNTELTGLPRNINLVTAFSAAFNLTRGVLWDTSRWDFFLRSLRRHVLAEDGALFMTLMNRKLDEETWPYLKAKAEWFVDQDKHILIKKFSA
jgi:hypothetical protein